MKKKVLSIVLGSLLLMIMLTGCSGNKAASLVNTLEFDIGKFQSIRLDYDSDDIRVLEGETGKIFLKEYMNENKKGYYAKATTQDGELFITEGERPRRSSFESYIDLYIPLDYSGSLSLHSTSGTVESKTPLDLSGNFRIETTSGVVNVSDMKASEINVTTTNGIVEGNELTATSLKIVSTNGDLSFDHVKADTIQVKTTNANTTISNASGVVTYESKGGKLTMTDIKGSGSYDVSGEGLIEASFTDVTGDISAYTKNGYIKLVLPNLLDFNFSAITKEGSIDTSFSDQLSVTDNTAVGIIGSSPHVTIELETRNGDINVSR